MKELQRFPPPFLLKSEGPYFLSLLIFGLLNRTVNLAEIILNKSLKAKAKTSLLSAALLNEDIKLEDLLEFAKDLKDSDKATCIEALEYATKIKPTLATPTCMTFMVNGLSSEAPRVKWESARVIANIASQFPDHLEWAIQNLLINTEHEGTVVRWSAALALGEIIKLNTPWNQDLIPAAQAIEEREEDHAIRKKYQLALKKVLKKKK